ncbi:MAG TPA: helix-turn-helix transcriptional regulator [Candidatus Sulfotelmatobacter sp.]|nr:helix-turn-helix transcriptional regulator [Candidatus Sulfotelmatobacter sp.]HWI60171.1 helix-turn-helix transcriptional regulator [Bacillota bacterium]
MSTVAEQLQQARLAKQLTVEQVAEITKLRTDHVRALEQGDFDAFSAPVYIRGFVRTYSGLLKLNVPQVMATLDAELGQTKKFAEPPPLTDRPRGVLDFLMYQLSKLDWRKGGLLLAVVVVLGGVLGGLLTWRHYRTTDPLKGLKPGVYQPAQRTSGQTLPLPAATPRR